MEEILSGTLAIDLGNTNTVVAFQDQKVDINPILVEIPNITSAPGVIPTEVWFEEPSKILKIGKSGKSPTVHPLRMISKRFKLTSKDAVAKATSMRFCRCA